jgi:hypothetical protein
MNRDSILSVYSDARTEYTKQLCVFLVPAYFQFFIDLLEKGKLAMVNEPKKALWQFQNYLNEIHDWNMEKVNTEIHTIHTNCGCDYLEDLLTAVFIAHTKVLTAIRLSAHQKKVEINIPKVEHFLFKVMCETSKLLWSSTYLFRDGIPAMEKQQNYRTIEGILNEGILAAVRSLVPVKSILKDFVNQDVAGTAEEDSDEEEDKPKEEKPKEHSKETGKEPAKEDLKIPISPDIPLALPLTPIASSAVQEKTEQPVIVIEDRPTVRFGQFDAMFDSEDPQQSDMIYDPKEEKRETDLPDDSAPVLSIMEEEGIPLAAELDFDSLDGKESEAMEAGDYEEL